MNYEQKEFNFEENPIRIGEAFGNSKNSFSRDEVIAVFDDEPDEDFDQQTGKISRAKIEINPGDRRSCNCNRGIQLWKIGDDKLKVLTHGNPVKGGSVTQTITAGAKKYAFNYALNLNIPLPNDSPVGWKADFSGIKANGADPVIIAVLDTGIDKNFPKELLWQRPGKNKTTAVYGHSFIDDDDKNIWISEKDSENDQKNHGTIVSLFIVQEFLKRNVPVQLMILKTHDENGNGSLFNIMQAINYAIKNEARIINASWGFYSYFQNLDVFLNKVIGKKLKEKNVLFISAAGNKIPEVDEEATRIFLESHPRFFPKNKPDKQFTRSLRNLAFHNFFPACLSNSINNFITVTTVHGDEVSQSQNYSNRHVDLGVTADALSDGEMVFRLPFQENGIRSGSSFATAIASGLIGSNYHLFKDKPSKSNIFKKLSLVIRNNNKLYEEIRKGKQFTAKSGTSNEAMIS